MAPLREKIAYALGDAASGGITWKIMSIAFPLFFTHVFGLSFADAAALMLVARIFDVFTDPLMGSIADRTKSRWGTYRPWLIFGAIPFGIIFTKGDKMGPNALKAMVEKDCEILSRTWEELPPMFTSSSRTAAGREEILNYIESILASL